MSDDVLARAKASRGEYLSAIETEQLIEDLIALAESQAGTIKELRAGGAWVEHIERERAMKRERDGECICNRGPDTEGPDEFCPWHGRPYPELVNIIESQAKQLAAVRKMAEAVNRNSMALHGCKEFQASHILAILDGGTND